VANRHIRREHKPITVAQATKEFLADAEARNLKYKTIYKYRLTFRQLMKFGERQGIGYVNEIDRKTLQKFRASWKDKNIGALKKLERLRSFFRFASLNGWIAKNPAGEIKKPKTWMRPTSPFSSDEMLRILTAASERIEDCRPAERASARRLRGLVLLLRYSGMGISDAVNCSVDRLSNGRIRVYTRKTGAHVYCPLPAFVVTELGAIPRRSKRHWFLTDHGKLLTAVSFWQRRLIDLFKRMEVTEFARKNRITKDEAREQVEARGDKFKMSPARRFRDTFAVGLLLAGVSLERVSILLGDTSIKITERHFAPWVRKRQGRAKADIEQIWAQDAIALLESEWNREAHGRTDQPRSVRLGQLPLKPKAQDIALKKSGRMERRSHTASQSITTGRIPRSQLGERPAGPTPSPLSALALIKLKQHVKRTVKKSEDPGRGFKGRNCDTVKGIPS
jgi:site-specific recombinase XerD